MPLNRHENRWGTCGSSRLIVVFLLMASLGRDRHSSDAIRLLNVINGHSVQPRSLIFPPTAPTRVQFIGGVGIPVENLNFESVTSGYVLKAEYFLPTRADEFRQKIKPQTIHRRRRSGNDTLMHESEYIFNGKPNMMGTTEVVTDVGQTNVTRMLSQSYHRNVNGHWKDKRQQRHAGIYRWIIYRAMEMILNKSTLSGHACLLRSICEHAATPFGDDSGLMAEILHIILTPSTSRDDSLNSVNKDYLDAELFGRSGESCLTRFGECKKSPMELISKIFLD